MSTAVLMVPRAQSLTLRLSVKARLSPAVDSSIILRPRMQTACSRVREALGEAVVAEVPAI